MDASNITNRLKTKFGLGTNPDLRLALYEKLARLVTEGTTEEGAAVYETIASCVADAEGKDDPGRYFARVVLLRLQERGLVRSREAAW